MSSPNMKDDPRASWLLWAPAVIALAWLPGQSVASAGRFWMLAAVIPLLAISRRFPIGAALAPWLGLSAVALVSALWVERPGHAAWQALLFWGWLWAAAIGRQLDATLLRRLAPAVAAAGVLAASTSVAPWWPRHGTFGNPNMLATLLCLTSLWTGAWLVAKDTTRPHRLLAALAILAQLFVLWRLESLGAGVALAAGALAGLWLWLRRTQRPRRAWGVLIGAALLLSVAAGWAPMKTHLRGRLYMANVSANIVADQPLFGVGAGQFPAAWMESQAQRFDGGATSRDDRDLWTLAHHAHNETLQVAAEMGAFGLVLFLFPVAVGLWRRRGSEVAFAGVVAGLVLGLVASPLYEPATALLFGLCLGALLGPTDVDARVASPWPRRMLWTAAATAALIASADVIGDRTLRRGVEDVNVSTLERAATLSLKPERAMRHQAELLRDRPEQARALATTAATRMPSPSAWAQVGEIAAAQGDIPGAIAAYERSVALHPWFFTGYYNLAVLWKSCGNYEHTYRYAVRASSLKPGDPRLAEFATSLTR